MGDPGARPGRERFGIRVDKQYFNFCSAHFLIFADGSREELHGHNYHVSIEIEGRLDAGNMVLDFIPFKPLVKRICDNLDHRTLLPSRHPGLRVEEEEGSVIARFGDDRFAFPARDVRILPIANTSTECLARWIAEELLLKMPDLFPEASIARLRVAVSESPGQAGWYERLIEDRQARSGRKSGP